MPCAMPWSHAILMGARGSPMSSHHVPLLDRFGLPENVCATICCAGRWVRRRVSWPWPMTATRRHCDGWRKLPAPAGHSPGIIMA